MPPKKQSKVAKRKPAKARKESKANRIKIHQLNSNINEIHEIQQLVGSAMAAKPKHALDTKTLKEDLKKDEKIKEQNRTVNRDLKEQLDLLTGMVLK